MLYFCRLKRNTRFRYQVWKTSTNYQRKGKYTLLTYYSKLLVVCFNFLRFIKVTSKLSLLYVGANIWVIMKGVIVILSSNIKWNASGMLNSLYMGAASWTGDDHFSGDLISLSHLGLGLCDISCLGVSYDTTW